VSVQGNRLDGFSSTTSAVILRMAEYCGFSDNEVSSNFAGPLAYMRADHVGANNNRLMTRDDLTIMVIDARGYVVMGNMTTGGISVIDDGAAGGLPEPWKSLNIII
jgi:hypothetical protein